VLAKQRRAREVHAAARELRRRRHQREGRGVGEGHVAHEGLAQVERAAHHLGRRQHRAAADAGIAEDLDAVVAALVGAPFLHDRAQVLAILAAGVVRGEARVVEQVLALDDLAPALEHFLADHLHDEPAVARLEDVGRARHRAAVARWLAVAEAGAFLHQDLVGEVERGAHQRGLDMGALAAAHLADDCRQRAIGQRQ